MQHQEPELEQKKSTKSSSTSFKCTRRQIRYQRYHPLSSGQWISCQNWTQDIGVSEPNTETNAEPCAQLRRNPWLHRHTKIPGWKRRRVERQQKTPNIFQHGGESNEKTYQMQNRVRFEWTKGHGAILLESSWWIWCCMPSMGSKNSCKQNLAEH